MKVSSYKTIQLFFNPEELEELAQKCKKIKEAADYGDSLVFHKVQEHNLVINFVVDQTADSVISCGERSKSRAKSNDSQIPDDCKKCWCYECGHFEDCIVPIEGYDIEDKPCPCDGCYKTIRRYMPKEKPPCENYIKSEEKQ